MFNQEWFKRYRYFRANNVPAKHAAQLASNEHVLHYGIENGVVRVRWETDPLAGDNGVEAIGVILEKSIPCAHCEKITWFELGALWGFEIPVPPFYLRRAQAEVAAALSRLSDTSWMIKSCLPKGVPSCS